MEVPPENHGYTVPADINMLDGEWHVAYHPGNGSIVGVQARHQTLTAGKTLTAANLVPLDMLIEFIEQADNETAQRLTSEIEAIAMLVKPELPHGIVYSED